MSATTVPVTDQSILPGLGGAQCECLMTNLSWLLAQASHAFGCEVSAALEPLGLGSRGFCVLSAASGGEFTQSQLAGTIGLDKTMMMVTLDDLERLGLAERRRSATDRRAHVIAVTKAGRAMLTEAQALIETTQRDVLSTLPAEQREALIAGLQTLVSGRLSEPPACQTPQRRRTPGH